MKVLYFSRDYTPHDHRFLSALARSEHQVSYLRLEQRGHSLEDRPLPAEVRHIPWTGGCSPATLRDGPRLLAGLRRVIGEVQPDLIHAGPVQRAAFLTALTGFRPLVSASWGYDLLVDANRNPLWRWATRFTLRRSSALVGDCQTIRNLAVEFGMRADRIVTFPWGVDLRRFHPPAVPQAGEAGSQDGEFVLLSTRGWEPVYGVEVVARAFGKAFCQLEAAGGPSLRLLMLGGGSQANLLRQVFIQDGVLDNVHFPGQISQSDLPRYYRSADLYISASHSDGSSISLLEAMASGRPVLVSDIPGNREWVSPGVNGWLFRDGDADDLARAIVEAAVNPTRLAEMGREARQIVEQRADWEQNFPKLLEAYELARQDR